jgi:hypothetical protein
LEEVGRDRSTLLRFEASRGNGRPVAAIPLEPGRLEAIIAKGLERVRPEEALDTEPPLEADPDDEDNLDVPGRDWEPRPGFLAGRGDPYMDNSVDARVKRAKADWGWRYKFPDLADLVTHFKKALVAQLPDWPLREAPEAPMVGDLVQFDDGMVNGTVTYAVKIKSPIHPRDRRYHWIARLILRKQSRTLDMLLPVAPDVVRTLTGRITMAKLSPLPTRVKRFPSISYRQTKEGVALAAEVIGLAVRKGHLKVEVKKEL